MDGNFLCVPTDVWKAEIISDCIFPLSALVSGPPSWASKDGLGSGCTALFSCDIQPSRLSVYICECDSFSSSWFLTLSHHRGPLSPLTSASLLPWVCGGFCEHKLWLISQMIAHCWWAGSSAVFPHQRQRQSLQHKMQHVMLMRRPRSSAAILWTLFSDDLVFLIHFSVDVFADSGPQQLCLSAKVKGCGN